MVGLVSDAGPLIHLAQVSKLGLLKKLFGRVSITKDVKREHLTRESGFATMTPK